MIIKEMNQNLLKFDNTAFNRLVAYTAIINSLNYKWYKSSKRRLLLPNFYFTRFFYNFYCLFFLKNTFRKKIQSNNKYSLYNLFGFFEKKMFLKSVNTEDFLKSSNSYSFFLNNKNIFFLKNDKFFFKKPFENFYLNSNLFVSNNIFIDSDTQLKLNFFKKNLNTYEKSVDFDLHMFTHLFNFSIIEMYKIFILLQLNKILINF